MNSKTTKKKLTPLEIDRLEAYRSYSKPKPLPFLNSVWKEITNHMDKMDKKREGN